jgi:HKD family nuclease
LIIQVIDNQSEGLVSILNHAIETSIDIRIAVAFVSRHGLSLIDNSLNYILNSRINLEFLLGLDMRATDPQALRYIYNLSKQHSNLALYCYGSLEASSIYHPKLYILKGDKIVTSIIGSSNLTVGGLKNNIEVNMIITLNEQEEILSDLYATYNRLKFHPKRVIPDDEFIEYYSSLCNLEKKVRTNFKRNNLTKELLNKFKTKAESLKHPQPTCGDLVGWTRLVFDQLPIGEFTTTQIYAYENDFANVYPENQNIKAKIRQQLQVLRDMGLIDHIGKSKWRKSNQK